MTSRAASLVELQERMLAEARSSVSAKPVFEFLPFSASGATWLIRSRNIVRLMMPADVLMLNGYSNTPACLLGVTASGSDMLSVVDAGLLLGSTQVALTLKTRLIVFEEGSLKGIALLVDRVHDRVASSASMPGAAEVTPDAMHAMLIKKIEFKESM